ncbi:MAG TPA: hypothetical protein VI197_25060 [Polyangiaceae bacterium]
MKAFASQVCFGVCVLLVGCGGDDDAPGSTASGGAGGTNSSGGSSGAGGSAPTANGGSATNGGSGGDAGAAGAPTECESPPIENEIDIAGAFRDHYDGAHRIDDEVWQMGSSIFDLIEVSNEEGWAIAENSADNEFFPASFSRFEWTREGGQLYYCQSVFAASTAAEAGDPPRADADDLAEGCGGFAWSSLTPIELIGSYEDDFGGAHTITSSAWQSGSSSFHLLEFSNGEGWAITQNDCANAYFPGLYSRFDWVAVEGGQGGAAGAGGAGADAATYYCQTGYNLDSAEAALELEPADSADLTEGCNGFPWSKITAQD